MRLRQRMNDVETRLERLECHHAKTHFVENKLPHGVIDHPFRLPERIRNYSEICVACGAKVSSLSRLEYLNKQKAQIEADIAVIRVKEES